MTTKFSIEDVPSKKEKTKLLDTIKSLIPEPIPGKDGKEWTKEELLAIIQPLIPEAPKTASKSELRRMIADYIESHKEEPPTLEFSMVENEKGTLIKINGVEHIIPRAVYGPKLRNFIQLGDTPGTYTGGAGKFVKVNSTETALEYGTVDTNIAWGDITGTLSDQTDLQTALNAKQATLVSGTNIKTINSISLLGSGDIAINGTAIGGAVTSGTAGSVLFINPNAVLAQDNQNFYYNNTEKRLSLFSALGSEVVTNGNFTGNASGWTVPSGMAYSSNSVSKTGNGTSPLFQTLSVYTRREYLLTYTITNWTVGTVTPSMGSSTGTAVGANGTYTERFIASGNSISIVFTPTNTARFTIDSVSIKPLTGNSQKTNINTGGLSIEGSWSNGTPGTTRAQTFNNDGSYTWTDYLFAGVLRAATGANSSGGHDTYTSGGNGAAYYNGNSGLTSNSMYSYNYSGYFYHYGNIQAVGHGMFGGKVGAGTGASTTPTSTLTVNGGEAKKTRRVTTNTTLDDTAYFWIVDASTPSCNGTPSVTTCSTYTASGQAVCESHLPCAWFAGNSCSAFNNEYGMGSCSGTGGCSADTSSCSSAGDESSCTSQNSSYGGSCAWSGSDCSGFDESQCGSYSGSGCTVNTSDCSAFNGNESGCSGQSGCSVSSSNTCSSQGDESSCVSAGCSWDGMSCTGDNSTCSGSYFTGCTGTYYSCTGTYYSGNCSGTYGAACSGTATCSGYASSGACTGEAGCSWVTAATITLPDSAVLPNYSCAIYNGSSTGADVNIVAPAGHTVDVSVLSAYKDSVILQGFNDARQCSEFSSAGACTPTGCSANYFNCSWNSGDNTCSGNAVCDGIGDQSTCESTSYFSSCSGTWYASKNYYRLAS